MVSYLIHDNGGRPFKVIINSVKVSIYKLDKEDKYTILVKEYKIIKKFIGKSNGANKISDHSKASAKQFNGNSILLQILDNKYVYIGSDIYEFTINDEIKKYVSPVGHSDVPYPVAVGTENVYFMLDKQFVPIEYFSKKIDWNDAYILFYGHDNIIKNKPICKFENKKKKMKINKTIK